MLDEAVKVAQKTGGKVKINADGSVSIEFWRMWNICIYVCSNHLLYAVLRSCIHFSYCWHYLLIEILFVYDHGCNTNGVTGKRIKKLMFILLVNLVMGMVSTSCSEWCVSAIIWTWSTFLKAVAHYVNILQFIRAHARWGRFIHSSFLFDFGLRCINPLFLLLVDPPVAIVLRCSLCWQEIMDKSPPRRPLCSTYKCDI